MKEILEKFKELYKGKDVVKRHCMLLLILLVPSILGSLRYLLDKDTPREILLPSLCIFGVLLLLSILPFITLSGFATDFYNRKIKNKLGLPNVNIDTFIKGLKILPLQIVWGIYGCVLFGVLFFVPLFYGIFGIFKNPHPEPLIVVGFVIGIIFLYLLTLLIFAIIAPFFGYAYFTFIEDFVYRTEYFYPFLFIKYMKMVFKDTMIVLLKYFVVSIIVSTVVSIISGIVGMFGGIFAISIGMIFSPSADNPMYTPAGIAIIIPLATILTLLTAYSGTIVGFAAGSAYLDIYKREIRLPDPLENAEEEQENKPKDEEQQESPKNDGGWVE